MPYDLAAKLSGLQGLSRNAGAKLIQCFGAVNVIITYKLDHDVGEYFETHEPHVFKVRVSELVQQYWHQMLEDWHTQDFQEFLVR